MSQRIAVVAIRHPTEPDLYLHGLRVDSGKWNLIGGSAHSGESMDEAIKREAKEEAGLDLKNPVLVHNKQYGDNDVYLFMHDAPVNLDTDTTQDPDSEFVTFKFLNPTVHRNLHVPAAKNILVEHMQGLSKAMVWSDSAQKHLMDTIHNKFYPTTAGKVDSKYIKTHDYGGKKIHEYQVSQKGSKPQTFYSINENDDPNGKHVSAIRMDESKSIPQLTTVATVPEHQKKGHGYSLHEFAAQKYGRIQSDADLTESTHNMWRKLHANPKYTVHLSGYNSPGTHTLSLNKSELAKAILPIKAIKPAQYQETTQPEYTHKDYRFKEVIHPHTPQGQKAFRLTDPEGQHDVIFAKDHEAVGAHINRLAWTPKWNLAASELEKASRYSLHVEPFHEHADFNPQKHDFVVRTKYRGRPIGFMAFTHKPNGIMVFNTEVDPQYRNRGVGTAMLRHGEQVTNKLAVQSPDMTPEAKRVWLKHISNRLQTKKSELLAKTDPLANEEANPLMNRVEDKYFLRASKVAEFVRELSPYLKAGDSDTDVRFNLNRSFYMDNPDMDAFRDSIDGIKPRFKVRIRQYSPNGKKWEDVAYVELKAKDKDGVTKKVRIRIRDSQIDDVLSGKEIISTEDLLDLNRDISREVLWKRTAAINSIISKYGFRKQLVVEYERRAYSDDELRVTIDNGLCYYDARSIDDSTVRSIKNSDDWQDTEKRVGKVSSKDYVILEVKHQVKTPGWIRDLLEKYNAKEVKFSKYCAAVTTYINTNKESGFISRKKSDVDANFIMDLLGDKQINKSELAADLSKATDQDYAKRASQSLTLLYPVLIGGEKYRNNGIIHHISIKPFGPSEEFHPDAKEQLISEIDKYGFNQPLDAKKLRFIPHKLPAFGGGSHHVLLVSGLPPQYHKFQRDMDHIGHKIDRYLPHVSVDKEMWERLNAKGSDLSASDVGFKAFPAELKDGNQVLKTY